jgi:hypothetical protein
MLQTSIKKIELRQPLLLQNYDKRQTQPYLRDIQGRCGKRGFYWKGI